MNPKIGNAASSPTVSQFEGNRSLWSKKFFSGGGGPRGGAQSFVIEIPTNQAYLYNKREVVDCIDCIDGSILFTIIIIFVILTKKTYYRFRKIKNKLSNLFFKLKTKFKRKNLVRKKL